MHTYTSGASGCFFLETDVGFDGYSPPHNDVTLEQVIRKYLRFLRALLSASDETLHDIRFKDPANSEHMRHMPESVRRLWEVGVGLLC